MREKGGIRDEEGHCSRADARHRSGAAHGRCPRELEERRSHRAGPVTLRVGTDSTRDTTTKFREIRTKEEKRMRYQVMLATMALGVAMSFGHAVADGGDDSYGAREVGTVRFIDRALNLIQLEDGTELRTTDARMLKNIKEGMRVTVDFTNDGSRNEINTIAPVTADSQVDVSPTAGGD